VQGHRFIDVEAVLFDLDGTLIDSAPDLAGAVEAMRLKRGLPPLPLTQYRPMAGAGARGMLGVGFGIAPDHPDFLALREEFFLAYEHRLTRNTVVFPGVASMIAALVQRRMPWGVVTNKSKRFTQPLTQALPLFSSAKTIISGDTTAFSKPHPQPLLGGCPGFDVGSESVWCMSSLSHARKSRFKKLTANDERFALAA
jgi:phosphoglycolate phosphatase-like HAD superfamily hydrolase